MSSKDEIFVTYGDVSVYKSDLNWLNPGQWLNDAIISAMFEFYSREEFKEEVSKGLIYFLSPAVVALLTFLDDPQELKLIFAEQKLESKRIVVIPVNDKTDMNQAVGGSHWSLLVYVRDVDRYFYLDSSKSMNLRSAKRIMEKVDIVISSNNNSNTKSNLKLIELKQIPQQTNFFDCGMFLLLFSEQTSKLLISELTKNNNKNDSIENLTKNVFDLISNSSEFSVQKVSSARQSFLDRIKSWKK